MCGITGILPRDPAALPDMELLGSMIRMLRHRGPDCQRVWEAPGVGLAHSRLSILDLNPRSHQPLEDPETGSVIVFNGEIYNYIELRQELSGLGYSFRTQSDTEVIPKAYAAWGVACLARFNGMWAFALYDTRNRRLFCARDRFGIKPFCYGVLDTGDLVFASEHKVLWTHFPQFRRPCGSFVSRFLNESISFSPYRETFYEGISHLLPGHYFLVSNGEEVKQQPFYRVRQELQDPLPSPEEAGREFTHLLEDAIRLRYRSDVPVGSCMSGGLDSPVLVGLATRIFQRPLYTFSCVYPEYPSVDEGRYIAENARHFGSLARTITPRFEDFVELVRQSTWEQDGPTGGPSLLSQRAVMELAHPEVRVLIDGQGADEVLGGYHVYFPYKLRSLARELARSPSWGRWQALRQQRRFQEARTGQKSRERTFKWVRHTRKGKLAQFGQSGTGLTSTLYLQSPLAYDDLDSVMLEHTRTQLVDLLHYEDRNSMAYSIETRLPYLDYRIVDFAFSLPHGFKINGERTKVLLHEIARDLLPPTVYHRRDKMGFSTPGQFWFQRKESVARFDTLLSDSGHAVHEYLSEEKRLRIRCAWECCKAGQPVSFMEEGDLWRVLTTAAWLELLAAPLTSARAPAGIRVLPAL